MRPAAAVLDPLRAVLAVPILWVSAAVAAAEGPVPSPPRFRALVVGIGSHADAAGWVPLAGAPRDARSFADLLTQRFGLRDEDVTLLLDADATRARILAAFEEHLIQESGPETVAIFYFAGHGSQVWDQDGDENEGPRGLDETLCPYDSVGPGDARADILDDTLCDLFRRLAGRSLHVVGIFDSCHSGTAMRGAGKSRARSAPPRYSPEGPPDATDPAPAALLDLSAMTWPGDTPPVFLMACRDDQMALESGDPPRGHFSAALEQVLRAVQPADTWGMVEGRVRARLYQERHEQSPQAFGPRNLPVFAGRFEHTPASFEILESWKNAQDHAAYVRVGAGLLHGLEVGTRLRLSPLAPADTEHAAVSTARVSDAGLEECVARVEQPLPGAAAVALARSSRVEVLEGLAPRFRTRLAFPGAAPGMPDLAPLEEWARRSPYFEPAQDDACDLAVGWDPARGFLAVDADGTPCLPHPFRGTCNPTVLGYDLECWAVYRSTRSIQNPGGSLGTQVDLTVELGCWSPEAVAGDPAAGPGGGGFQARPDLWGVGREGEPVADLATFHAQGTPCEPCVSLVVTNRSDQDLNYVLFDLPPSWEVRRLAAGFVAAHRSSAPLRIKLNDAGWTWEGHAVKGLSPELFKFLVTTGEIHTGFVESVGLLSEAQMKPPEPVETRGAGPTSSLEEWLRAAQQGGSFRGDAGALEPMPWTTLEFAATVVPGTGRSEE